MCVSKGVLEINDTARESSPTWQPLNAKSCVWHGGCHFFRFLCLANYFQSTQKSTQREIPSVDDAIRVWAGLHDRFNSSLNQQVDQWRVKKRVTTNRTDELGQTKDGNLRKSFMKGHL